MSKVQGSTIIGVDLVKTMKHWGYGRVRFHEKPERLVPIMGHDLIRIDAVVIFPLLAARRYCDSGYVITESEVVHIVPRCEKKWSLRSENKE